MKKKGTEAIENLVENRIFLIRGIRVMFDFHLAELYHVSTKRLNEQVRRNMGRFPADFMFQLTWKEAERSRSQFATLKRGLNVKYRPFVFTEQGVAMLSGVLRSKQAVQANIAIMRAFVKLRRILSAHRELAHQLNQLERKVEKHDGEIKAIFRAIRELMASPPDPPKRQIGFHV